MSLHRWIEPAEGYTLLLNNACVTCESEVPVTTVALDNQGVCGFCGTQVANPHARKYCGRVYYKKPSENGEWTFTKEPQD